ncbi:MAG: hypothetical protein HYV03_02670, partial [Deltaproteobacteria bacterium]|nr:hypothetical protein [Deltaproteobacteria bacterium]
MNAARLFVIVSMFFIGRMGFAASPWFVDGWDQGNGAGSGIPYTWGGGVVAWFIEEEDLGPLPFATVRKMVKDAFDGWAAAGILLPGLYPVDVVALEPAAGGIVKGTIGDRPTYEKYCADRVVIVMDPDGNILWSLGADPADVAAYTQICSIDPATLTVRGAATLLSGVRAQDLGITAETEENDPAMRLFRAGVVHEIGHLLNIDHSALGQELEGSATPNAGLGVPTMYPRIVTPLQDDLHLDDIVAAASLYPNPDFTAKFCAITGQLIGVDGKGFQGAMVIARAT